jgi:hypothetical protein
MNGWLHWRTSPILSGIILLNFCTNRSFDGALLECASHAGALLIGSHASDPERTKHGFVRQKREHGSRSPKSSSSKPDRTSGKISDSIGTSRQWHPPSGAVAGGGTTARRESAATAKTEEPCGFSENTEARYDSVCLVPAVCFSRAARVLVGTRRYRFSIT